MHGGDLVAEFLKKQGVKFIFTLCGGHISPILVGCKHRNIRVIDVRHEANAVFAADAVARLSGIPGVAAVTAGPGATNTITAIKNAQLAQSPLVLLGGAAATALQGRGALQDIDQLALFKPHVKWSKSVRRVRDLVPALEQAFVIAQSAVPGPVFLELPVDLLYDEALVREWYHVQSKSSGSFSARAQQLYLQRHLKKMFAGTDKEPLLTRVSGPVPRPSGSLVQKAAKRLAQAERPVLLIGSQAVLEVANVNRIAAAVEQLGVPVYLSGMARGLLGANHPLQMRHQRKQALKEADVVILAGVPCDFRLNYGRHIRRSSFLIAANRSPVDIKKNRTPELAVPGDAGRFLCRLAEQWPADGATWAAWHQQLRTRDDEREAEISRHASEKTDLLNPVYLCRQIEQAAGEKCVFVADGGDFVATASYIIQPRAPLNWLDPGVFGTLGVGAGFAIGAHLCKPNTETWILYGDGSAGYSLMEFDTFVRHNIPVIAVVGNDACWMQIAREQVEILRDDVGTVLRYTDYHNVAEGFGGKGLLLNDMEEVAKVLRQARELAAAGHPVLINAHLGKTDFRKGSISM